MFWVGMMIALTAAFFATFPVNRFLLQRGKGHALTHHFHHGQDEAQGARRYIPDLSPATLAAIIASFMAGGLLVAAASELSSDDAETHAAETRHR